MRVRLLPAGAADDRREAGGHPVGAGGHQHSRDVHGDAHDEAAGGDAAAGRELRAAGVRPERVPGGQRARRRAQREP